MTSPVKLYQREMHNNVGFFATWLPSSILELGDIGVLEAGRFRRVGSLHELGTAFGDVRKGAPQDMSYSASAERRLQSSAGAKTNLPAAKAEVAIHFTRQGGYLFEAAGIRNVEVSDRMALGSAILSLHEQGRWQEKWVLVDAVYEAQSATIIVSEDANAELVLNASGNVPIASVPLADPSLGLSVSSVSGKVVHVVAQSGLSPLYSCLKLRAPLFGAPSVSSVRGLQANPIDALARCDIEGLLDS